MIKIILQNKIEDGDSAANVLKHIINSCPIVQSVNFTFYSPPPILQDRICFTKNEKELETEALGIRDQFNLPFWDSIMLKSFLRQSVPSRILHESLFHQPNTNSIFNISRDEILNNKILIIANETNNSKWLSVLSDFKVDGNDIYHIPLLDFHCPCCKENDELVKEVAKILFPDGAVILDSGKSYHCYGLLLLTGDEFIDFLSKALLFSPIIDRAYIAHQLLERRCALRISRGGSIKKEPTVLFSI